MWTRGWRTSLPRGSSQKLCRKPGGPQGPSPALHTPIPGLQQGPTAKGMLGKAARPGIWPRARLWEEEWDGARGVQDVALESAPQWGGSEAAPTGTMLGMGALARTLPSLDLSL